MKKFLLARGRITKRIYFLKNLDDHTGEVISSTSPSCIGKLYKVTTTPNVPGFLVIRDSDTIEDLIEESLVDLL